LASLSHLVSDIEKKYSTVEEKFTTRSGKLQPNWTRFSIPVLAEKADPLLAKIYGPAFLRNEVRSCAVTNGSREEDRAPN
jgi:hypothetical protein